MSVQKSFLIILDGWGIGPKPERSAIAQANTPYFDKLLHKYPSSTLTTFGEQVGLPCGQMGNSEVGHLNIGAGRIVYQELARINNSLANNDFAQNKVFQSLVQEARDRGKRVHLLGLLSDGGVHAHINHIKSIASLLDSAGVETFLHAFMDGRDTDPKSGLKFMEEFEEHVAESKVKVASVIGRYFAMDRDNRWERIKKAYDLLVNGVGQKSESAVAAIEQSYDKGITDEFIEPISITDTKGSALATIEDGDIVFFLNFRTDRPRQLTQVLSQEDMPQEKMHKLDLSYYTMTAYDESFSNINVIFRKEALKDTLGEIVAREGLTQVRIAETEKYPHVTFFFNGGEEKEFPGERRLLIPSPKVPTYDLQPEMGAHDITEAIIDDIRTNAPHFICLNFANTDMVGHTGVFEAAMKAASTVDNCLSMLIPEALAKDYEIIIIADHGNSDYMINDDGSPHTAHTTNAVPIVYVSKKALGRKVQSGKLADVAPTLLNLMNISIPSTMTGEVLIDG